MFFNLRVVKKMDKGLEIFRALRSMISQIAIEAPVSKLQQPQTEHRKRLKDVECCKMQNF